jgi:CheY-like chemotaxis protein
VTLWLPTAEMSDETAEAEADDHAALRGVRLMVVEDEAPLRALLERICREAGMEVRAMADADSALALLRYGVQVDLLLTDIRMPGRLDGHGLAAEARALRPGLPVVLHAPHDAAPAALSILRRNDPRGVLFHWHKASPDVTRAICDAGYFVSVTPEVCYRERDQEMVRAVPLDNLLLESDGPWAYGGEFAGQPTTPALVARVAEAVAEIKGVPLADVKQATTENALRLFGRWR